MKLNNAKAQMRRGVLEFCILSIIAREEMYPSDIIKEMKTAELIVVEGTLYPMLTRLKNAGMLAYRWEESKSGPPRKYYRLTDEGTLALKSLEETWDNLVKSVGSITSTENLDKSDENSTDKPQVEGEEKIGEGESTEE